jgi:hypothetical protein
MDVLCVRVELSEAESAAGALLHSPPFSAPSSYTQIGFSYRKTVLEVVNFQVWKIYCQASRTETKRFLILQARYCSFRSYRAAHKADDFYTEKLPFWKW